MRIHDDILPVAHVSPTWPPEVSTNGIVASLAKLLPSAPKAGLSISVLAETMSAPTAGPVHAVEVVDVSRHYASSSTERVGGKIMARLAPVAWPSRLRATALARALHDISTSSPRLIEMEEAFGTSAFLQEKLSIPVVVRLHGPIFLTGRAMGVPNDRLFRDRMRLEMRGFCNAAAVSAPSRFVLNESVRRYDHTPPLSRVIPNAQPISTNELRWRPDAQQPETLLFVGRFDRVKGADLAIAAFNEVARQRSKARLVMVGPDHGLIDPSGVRLRFPEYIKRYVPDRRIAQRISYLGPQPQANVQALRRRASVCLICSRYETFPNTVLEAMAQGCPIVASDAGGIPEILSEDQLAWLFDSGNADQLAIRILEALESSEIAAKYGKAALEHCATTYSPSGLAGRVKEFYLEVLERTRP